MACQKTGCFLEGGPAIARSLLYLSLASSRSHRSTTLLLKLSVYAFSFLSTLVFSIPAFPCVNINAACSYPFLCGALLGGEDSLVPFLVVWVDPPFYAFTNELSLSVILFMFGMN